ncbi:hypothetical protein KAR91_52810 [Candidatus Pacearchaeota archaeon]|nr:hypothetical protein [Candidatus Pacearchaeota archaeon]
MFGESKREVKVAAIQMKCDEVYTKEKKIKKALKMINEAAKDGAKIIVLPELFSTEYILFHRRYAKEDPLIMNVDPGVLKYAETIPGPTIERIAELARKYRIYIISPIYEKAAPGVYYNSAPVIDPQGNIMGIYRKTHIPCARSLEKIYFRPGSEFPIFRTEYGTFGILICYDRGFPEAWRILALEGAEIVFTPVATGSWELGKPPVESFEFIMRTRCIENRVFAVLSDRTGEEKCEHCGGLEYYYSFIVNPQGEVIAKGTRNEEEIVSATLNIHEVEIARMRGHPFRDLRPEIYQRLIQRTSIAGART